MARRASAIEKLRTQDHGTLILDAGDALFSKGTPKPTKQQLVKAEVMLRGHGLLGMDALAVGEAELTMGLERLRRLARQTSQTLLCANLTDRAGKPAFTPRKLVQAGPVKVGLTAVLELPATDRPSASILGSSGLRVQPAKAALTEQVQALRAAGAELVLVLAHTGMEQAQILAREVSGVHLFLVAHSGQLHAVPLSESKALLLEPGQRGMSLAHVQVRLGQGWQPDDRLVDGSTRQVLYDEVQEELASLRKRPATSTSSSSEDPRVMRARALIRRFEATPSPAGAHLVVVRMIALGAEYTAQAALQGLMDAHRASWQAPRQLPPPRPSAARFRRVPGARQIQLH